ncbi:MULTISPECIES: flagellar hook assembly protein FlgD [Clostridium]|jgi:flagellar basal-body rod modification protein FlgD|uniref:Basal-body rod modification protein FlgD n=1 Tax=Clostridium intestinale DSM 6191 TaxID=1121320 RepID=A0A1M5Y012_9CLOT|nr:MULTISPECIES: flagellar hook capping FlgD N-terminal domain-containing protein [Clostridium]WRY53826.1 flagellar hook capping FlgD N-terminal domain-containing protein [Clostridium intestinale]SHI05332.1 flagellar basal-body rod modification protein FlgD [Clostridium intestinale DSM 6191]
MASTSAIGYNGSATATDRGTKIVKAGSDLNKNSFLKILAAELSNQDPTANVDSTQYISQMAQFTSMEQMANLNTTMSGFANQSLVGKGVTVNVLDSEGNPYTGVVNAVTTQNGSTTLSVTVNEKGTNVEKNFDLNTVVSVVNVPDYSLPVLTNLNGNMSFLLASGFIGKNVELTEKDSSDKNIKGTVIGVSKDNGVVNIKLKVDGSDEILTVSVDKVSKVENKE